MACTRIDGCLLVIPALPRGFSHTLSGCPLQQSFPRLP
jgi:hypothetical protein